MSFQYVLEEECARGWLWQAHISTERSVSARLWHSPWKRRPAPLAGQLGAVCEPGRGSGPLAQPPCVLDPETLRPALALGPVGRLPPGAWDAWWARHSTGGSALGSAPSPEAPC